MTVRAKSQGDVPAENMRIYVPKLRMCITIPDNPEKVIKSRTVAMLRRQKLAGVLGREPAAVSSVGICRALSIASSNLGQQ